MTAERPAENLTHRFNDINDRQVLEALTVIGRCRLLHVVNRTSLPGYLAERSLARLEKQGKVSHSGDWWELTAQ